MKISNKIRNSIIWIMFITFLLMVFGELIGAVIFSTGTDNRQPYFYTFMEYACFITMWLAVIFVINIFKKNRYIQKEFLPNKKGNTILYLVIGLISGFVLNGFCACLAIVNGNISLNFQCFEVMPVMGLFIAVFIQSSAEEVLCRGFLYQRVLEAKSKYWIAILLNSVFFGVAHGLNDGITLLGLYDLIITGIFFSLVVFYFDSLWMAMGLHTTWNFTQSIILGLPNSGASFPYSVFALTPDTHGGFSYNTAFGLEGTPLSAILMTICCLGLYLWKNKEKNIWSEN